MGKAESRRFAEGDVICRQGDPADSLFILQQGRVAVVVCPGEDQPDDAMIRAKGVTVAEIADPGAMLGEAGLFLHKRTATLKALDGQTSLEEVTFDEGGLEKLIEARPDTGLKLCRSLALRLRNLSSTVRRASEEAHTIQILYDSLCLAFRSTVRELTELADGDRKLAPVLEWAQSAPHLAAATQIREKVHSTQGIFAKALKKRRAVSLDLAPGSTLFNQNDEGNTMFYIEEGSVEVFMSGRTVATLGAGEFVGEVAALVEGATKRAATIKASDNARVTSISPEEFEAMATETPELLPGMAISLCRRMEAANRLACDTRKGITDELDRLAGHDKSVEASFRELEGKLKKHRKARKLAEKCDAQAERAVAARKRMEAAHVA